MVDLTWKYLPFLLSARLTSPTFPPVSSRGLRWYKRNQTTLLCFFFSASFYYKHFPPNTFKGVVPKCTCDLLFCRNWEKRCRIQDVLVLNMHPSVYLCQRKWDLVYPASVIWPPWVCSWGLRPKTSAQRPSLCGTEILGLVFKCGISYSGLPNSFLSHPTGGGGNTDRLTC